MLPNLQVILFFISFVIKNFKKVFICRFAMCYIIIYYIIIILNLLDKIANYIKLGIIKSWST